MKQRNIFSDQIDEIKDSNEPQATKDSAAKVTARELVALHNAGVRITGKPKRARKGYSDTPLFQTEQPKLF